MAERASRRASMGVDAPLHLKILEEMDQTWRSKKTVPSQGLEPAIKFS
jgi:hypothetical protein